MDFITSLPLSIRLINTKAYDLILVVVDRYLKYALYIPTTKKVDAHELATLFIRHVIPEFGIPKGIVLDRGLVFTSNF